MAKLLLRLFNPHGRLVKEITADGPIELGRQRKTDSELGSVHDLRHATSHESRLRFAVAPPEEASVSREHALLSDLTDNGLMVRNLSHRLLLPFLSEKGLSASLPPGAQFRVPLPATLVFHDHRVRVMLADDRPEQVRVDAGPIAQLPIRCAPPGQSSVEAGNLSTILLKPYSPMSIDSGLLIRSVIGLLKPEHTKESFFDAAASLILDLARLDQVRLLLWDADRVCWVASGACQRSRAITDPSDVAMDEMLLEHVRSTSKTSWTQPRQALATEDPNARARISMQLASPLLDTKGEVIGAILGTRSTAVSEPISQAVGPNEATLVELIAHIIANVLARNQRERRAAVFERFFPEAVARRLPAEPALLNGCQRQVTLLFSDIRGFSRISKRIGPAATMAWIGEVMESLSGCVDRFHGVLVDMIGDALFGMWGAPDEQPEQASLACSAAVAMIEAAHLLDLRLRDQLGEPFQIGIGINTGPAYVGNTGSRQRFKYGALGNAVNLASRVESATKHLQCPVLATGSTLAAIEGHAAPIASRRVCKARVENIDEPVQLYEIVSPGRIAEIDQLPEMTWTVFKEHYESALAHYEAGAFRESTRVIAHLLRACPDDGPALQLLARAAKYRAQGTPLGFDGVWELSK